MTPLYDWSRTKGAVEQSTRPTKGPKNRYERPLSRPVVIVQGRRVFVLTLGGETTIRNAHASTLHQGREARRAPHDTKPQH